MTATRFPKLTPETMTEAQRAVAAEISAGPRGEVRGPFIALIITGRARIRASASSSLGSKLPAL